MHPFDHFVSETLRAPLERLDQRLRALNLLGRWRKCRIAGRDLIRMNEALAVETKIASFLRFQRKAFKVLEAIEDAVERRDPFCASRKDDKLERG